MSRPRLLDLFCGAGGAAMGYYRAGFDVVGVDIKPQPRYPFDFIQGDALNPPVDLSQFDAIHASPPCQAYTVAGANERAKGKTYPDLVIATRALLTNNGAPWAMENVPGSPLRADIILCGSHFGLPIARHRLFELSDMPFTLLASCQHARDLITICGSGTPSWCRKARIKRGLHPNFSVSMKRDAMEMPWANRAELSQAIPPAYTEFIGRHLLGCLAPR